MRVKIRKNHVKEAGKISTLLLCYSTLPTAL